MVGWALDRLAARDGRRVVELCAGSGAITAALTGEIGGIEAHAVEVDPSAFTYLQRNLHGRAVDLRHGDMADAFHDLDGTVDLVIVNPPYVPEGLRPFLPSDVVDHDPELALFSGADGLDAIRVVADVAMRLLAPAACSPPSTTTRTATPFSRCSVRPASPMSPGIRISRVGPIRHRLQALG
ncbi:methyltransferase [Tessaracoccus sp. HDW20]|uniref:methyltransferase n=1 Tax=Tessaracoccus coleopterorum TaxID=2714950 RepID=UPI0018D327AB|nr:methyltransferase [Tessaracoccus coleopterorum]NHB85972.1 methyltransferase [Tessaracoccus coleopterorum]